MMSELKPCPTPWCEGDVTMWRGGDRYGSVPERCPPRCRKCGVSAPDVATWNRRTPIHLDNERLQEAEKG